MFHLKVMRRNVPDERDRLTRLDKFASIPEKLAHVLLRRRKVAAAFTALEASKSRTMMERLGLADLPAPDFVPTALRERERECLETARILDQQILAPNSADSRERLNAAFATALETYDRVLNEIANYAPDYVELRRGSTLTYEDVHAMLT
jgi:hypothetical protein